MMAQVPVRPARPAVQPAPAAAQPQPVAPQVAPVAAPPAAGQQQPAQQPAQQDLELDTHYLQEGVFPPHPVVQNGVYRFWSMVSNGYLKRTTSTQVKCNGTDGTAEKHLTQMTARDLSTPTTKLFRFVLENPTTPSNEYVLTGGEEGTQVYLQDVPIRSTPPKDGESLFTPKYFYSTTMFNCSDVNGEKDLYIGSAADGNVTMVKGGADSYPNPFALFRLVSEI